MSTIQEFEAAAAKATQASAQADTWANGPINTTVPTDSGPVPTIAEFNRAALARVDASIEAIGWVLAGDFTAGCTVTDRNQYVLVVGGAGYRWDGVLPKVVAPGSSPTPIATGSWILVGDMSLRWDLAAAGGSGIVGFQQAGTGSVTRTSQDKMREFISVKDKGADKTGLTESTAAFLSAGYFAFVPEGVYLVDPAQVNIKHYWGPGKLRYTTDLSEHWCGLASRGTLYIRNDDTNPDTTPTVPSDGLINLADGELKLLCDLDGDGDYDADIYGKNNLYIAGENSIHFRIDPQGPAEGRIRLASTTNTNFIQSGKDFSGATLKNLAFGPYLSTNYWAFFSQSSGHCVLGNSASPAAPLHIYNQETTAALAENTLSSRARMGFKGSTTTSGSTVTFGANGDDAEMRAGGSERLIITSSGVVRPGEDNTQTLGSSTFRFATVFAGAGTINTSDAREKTDQQAITDAMLDAADEISISVWKWLDAIAKKGEESARWHFGPIAQQVRDAFAQHGLDGCDYGLLCYDKWGDEFVDVVETITSENGEVLESKTGEKMQVQWAGDRWGIRPDQCLWLLAAASRRRAQRAESRLDDIESRLSELEAK